MAIQVNTEAVRLVADQIDAANKSMRNDLSGVDNAIRALQQAWQGEASNACANKYEHIKSSFSDARYRVVNNMVSFMRVQVGESYETMERKLSNAASAFK